MHSLVDAKGVFNIVGYIELRMFHCVYWGSHNIIFKMVSLPWGAIYITIYIPIKCSIMFDSMPGLQIRVPIGFFLNF